MCSIFVKNILKKQIFVDAILIIYNMQNSSLDFNSNRYGICNQIINNIITAISKIKMGSVDSNPSSNLRASTNMRRNQIQRMKKQLELRQNQIRNLQIENSELKKKRLENPPQQQDEQVIIQMEDQAKEENEQTELRQLLKCILCEEQYNLTNRIPLMVCRNQHTYCSDCISRMVQKNKKDCPECRTKIIEGNRNVHLTQLLTNIDRKGFNQNSMTKSNFSKAQKLNISINKTNNVYLDKYQIVQENCLIRAGEHSWYGLLCNQIIPVTGKFFFTIQVIASLHNNIEIGLIDMNSKLQKGKMSNKRITYHLYDGKVMDSGHVDQAITKWKTGIGKPAPKGNFTINVEINMDDNDIRWTVNGQVYAQTIITNYIKYVKAVPYISMYHVEDIITLNS